MAVPVGESSITGASEGASLVCGGGNVSRDNSCLDINDLGKVWAKLKRFSTCEWNLFGLKAGLCKTTLDNIKANNTKVEDRFIECLSCWLKRQDDVDEQGKPSWRRLAEILEELEEQALADEIRANEILTAKSIETPRSSNSIIESEITIEDYVTMKDELFEIIASAIIDVSLNNIQNFLIVRNKKIEKMIGEVPDKKIMTGFCTTYFSLSNVTALKELAQCCKVDHIANRFNALLKKRNIFYEKILAKDFAMKSIVDHDGMCEANATITFKVSWNQDGARLKEFEMFLSTAFQNYEIYIRLRVVHLSGQSPLTFECSIPKCLKKEITDYVTKKKDQLIPKGVVEVTIDSAVIFNVERGYAALMFYEPNDMMRITAVPSIQLPALLKCIKKYHPCSEVGPIHYFHFESSHDSIELNFYQEPPNGWTIEPKNNELMQADIDKFNGTDDSVHPCCSILVRGSFDPNTELFLYSPITLSGIKCGPVTLFIHRILESTIPKTPIIPYTGLVYCEQKKDNTYVVGFVAAIGTNFKSLVDYIEDQHRIIKLVNFDFDPNSDIIKLNLQEISSSTWTAEPQSYELSKNEIDEALHDPPCRLISICRPPDAAQSVQYSLSLEGLTDPVSIDFKLDQTLHDNSYIGMVYYEWKKSEYLMTFVAGKKLTKLIQYIHKHHPLAEISHIFNFSFGSPHAYIELKFDGPQDHSCEGWTVRPLVVPCKLYQDDIDEATYPFPPSCLISVYGSPDAVPTLHYSIPLVGVVRPVTLWIDRKLQLEKDVSELIASHNSDKDKLKTSEEKVMELQEHIQSLRHELQVAHQYKVSLQEALVEANEQGSKVDSNKLVIMSEKLEKVLQEKQIITEDIEKLRATVAYNEVYITEIEEEKKQVEDENKQTKREKEQAEEEKRQLEEQYFIDKQITKELKAKVAGNDVYIAKLEEEKKQVEEQYCIEKQITEELKRKIADNEFYTAKLLKERKQWSQTKETSSTGYNSLVLSMDLSDVQVAEKKLFSIQGDKPQLMNWEKYGLRIGVQEESLSSFETVEAAVVALVGGQFQFPPNTVLVSAVYEVSLSKPLLKPLQLEIQHCVDLTGRPDLARYLKFAIAPINTPSLPYQFSIVEGGEFKPDSWYGSIQRKEFCLVSIVGEKRLPKSSTNGDESEEEEEQEEQEEQAEEEAEEEVEDGNSDSSSDSDYAKDPPGASSGIMRESNSNEGVEEEGETGGQPLHEEGNKEQDNERVEESKNHEEATASIPCTEISSDFNSKVAVSTGIVKNMAYAGLVYYEKKEAEDLVTFTAAKDLNALLEFIKKDSPHAERGQNILFRFKDYDGHIELKFDAPQKEPFTGWSIKPHLQPCRFLRCDVDKFGEANYPLPSTCLISVYGSPGAVPSLHYSIPLDGVADPKTLFIHRSLRTISPLPSTNRTISSSSNVVHESTAVSSTGGARASATVDINKVKKVINDVLISHYADLTSLPMEAVRDLANRLCIHRLIINAVRDNPSMEAFITEFKASLTFIRKLPKVQEHCQKFLSSFIAVGGSCANAAEALGEDWIEAIRNELGFDFNINIDD